jgi:hypothetical protein
VHTSFIPSIRRRGPRSWRPGFRETRLVRVFPQGWNERVRRFQPGSVAGPLEQLRSLAREEWPLEQAVIVFTYAGGPGISPLDREALWKAFGVPVFEQYLGPQTDCWPPSATRTRDCTWCRLRRIPTRARRLSLRQSGAAPDARIENRRTGRAAGLIGRSIAMLVLFTANVAELADAPDLGSGSRKGMGVRPSPFAPQKQFDAMAVNVVADMHAKFRSSGTGLFYLNRRSLRHVVAFAAHLA